MTTDDERPVISCLPELVRQLLLLNDGQGDPEAVARLLVGLRADCDEALSFQTSPGGVVAAARLIGATMFLAEPECLEGLLGTGLAGQVADEIAIVRTTGVMVNDLESALRASFKGHPHLRLVAPSTEPEICPYIGPEHDDDPPCPIGKPHQIPRGERPPIPPWALPDSEIPKPPGARPPWLPDEAPWPPPPPPWAQ